MSTRNGSSTNSYLQCPIKFFEIKNLFGTKDYKIPVSSGVLILVGENGSGKSTVLNLIKALLKGDAKKLASPSIKYDSISVTFYNEETFSIQREHINSKRHILPNPTDSWVNEEPQGMTPKELKKAHEYFTLYDRDKLVKTNFFKKLIKKYGEQAQNYLLDGVEQHKGKRTLFSLKKNVLELPTYRRIEKPIRPPSYQSLTSPSPFPDGMKFGMDDVQKLIESRLTLLREIAIDNFTEVSKSILTFLATDISLSEKQKLLLQNEDDIELLLERIGSEIDEAAKNKILSKIQNHEILNPENKTLAYVIAVLLSSYELQKAGEERIKQFVKISNEYLFEKEIQYNERQLKICIKHSDGAKIELNDLSSGEKQILGLFSKLYLEETKHRILFFDEPEISISIDWQKKYLLDVVNSGSCSLVIAATHSPFIFDNELMPFAHDISEFVTRENRYEN